eukprot:CAMPEP_0195290876 /NCGR_PEP_ID=MMETSP0707-20130614/6564_1 /TAXON_ID=33640 /ORGANISM="Asterionellopsis glacialis, Strain CCMP134" /LENGTH=381 /DNA_ID=CAMNT_0040351057 /DNA_START=508 /DNA_END=1653 /DNA_ORIENTATION=-
MELDKDVLEQIDVLIEEGISDKRIPGGVFHLEHREAIYQKSFGNKQLVPKIEKATKETIYDLASLTKVMATTPSVMKLIEEGKIELDAPAQRYLPELSGDSNKTKTTIRHLLTHTSGLAAELPEGHEWSGSKEGVTRAACEPSCGMAGFDCRYSDINFILLGEIVTRVGGMPLQDYCRKQIFLPLGMKDTFFLPDPKLKDRIAPTALLEDGSLLKGIVHDPTCRRMGGVAGHAGLFGTVDDVALFARMLLNSGGGVLKPATVYLMTSVQSPANIMHRRGLGFDIDSSYSSLRGEIFPKGSFGHTGWTGTSIWIDPKSDTFVIFLSNRNHPSGGNVITLRKNLATLAAKATGFDFSTVKRTLPEVVTNQSTFPSVLPPKSFQ